jgi:two-component system alkaline phosphatase synthesis response regulator PhoP
MMDTEPAQGARILIVDDEPNILRLLKSYLEREGYEVATAGDGRSALQIARTMRPHLVVLDLLLPEIDGLEVCRQLRQDSDVFIIMATARSEEMDKILGLTMGADDYVTKPFSPREVVARVKAVLRRARKRDNDQEQHTLRFASMTIDAGRRTVTVRGKNVELTALEFNILRTLASQPGLVFSRAQLLERVWGYDYMGDERVVDVHIGLLREKIEEDRADPCFVKTVRGVGYKFDAHCGER